MSSIPHLGKQRGKARALRFTKLPSFLEDVTRLLPDEQILQELLDEVLRDPRSGTATVECQGQRQYRKAHRGLRAHYWLDAHSGVVSFTSLQDDHDPLPPPASRRSTSPEVRLIGLRTASALLILYVKHRIGLNFELTTHGPGHSVDLDSLKKSSKYRKGLRAANRDLSGRQVDFPWNEWKHHIPCDRVSDISFAVLDTFGFEELSRLPTLGLYKSVIKHDRFEARSRQDKYLRSRNIGARGWPRAPATMAKDLRFLSERRRILD